LVADDDKALGPNRKSIVQITTPMAASPARWTSSSGGSAFERKRPIEGSGAYAR
jgi:hypothetical protein